MRSGRGVKGWVYEGIAMATMSAMYRVTFEVEDGTGSRLPSAVAAGGAWLRPHLFFGRLSTPKPSPLAVHDGLIQAYSQHGALQ